MQQTTTQQHNKPTTDISAQQQFANIKRCTMDHATTHNTQQHINTTNIKHHTTNIKQHISDTTRNKQQTTITKP